MSRALNTASNQRGLGHCSNMTCCNEHLHAGLSHPKWSLPERLGNLQGVQVLEMHG